MDTFTRNITVERLLGTSNQVLEKIFIWKNYSNIVSKTYDLTNAASIKNVFNTNKL